MMSSELKEADREHAVLDAVNCSVGVDHRLAAQDIRGSIAHVEMMVRQRMITEDEASRLIDGLRELLAAITAGRFLFRPDREDVHTNIEDALSEKVGALAGKLSTGRARNDQVAVDFRLWIRDAIDILLVRTNRLIDAFLVQADRHADTIMPGFTHLQTAQPITFGHLCMAYVEMFHRDCRRLINARVLLNACPLGAAALAGTSFPIDRHFTADRLGFDQPMANSIDCVSDRDFVLDFLSAAATIAVHLSRFAEDLIIWLSQPFGLISLPKRLTSGSSIMPHKKNPDAAELVRAKAGRVIANLNTMLIVLKGLSLGYAKDMQEDKEPVFDTADNVEICLDAMTMMVDGLTVNADAMMRVASTGFTTSTDIADWLVREKGMTFRRAHDAVAALVEAATAQNCKLAELPRDAVRAILPELGGSTAEWPAFTVQASVASRTSLGGTAPARVREAILAFRARERPAVAGQATSAGSVSAR